MCDRGELEEGDRYCWSRSVNQRPSLQTGRSASRWKLLAIKSEKVEAAGWVGVAKWRKLLPECGRLMVVSQGRWLCVTLPHAVTKLNQYFTFLCRRARDDRRPSFRAMSFQLEQVAGIQRPREAQAGLKPHNLGYFLSLEKGCWRPSSGSARLAVSTVLELQNKAEHLRILKLEQCNFWVDLENKWDFNENKMFFLKANCKNNNSLWS